MNQGDKKMIKLQRLEHRYVTEKAELTLDSEALSELTDYIKQEYVPVNPANKIPTLTDDIIAAVWNGEIFDEDCYVRYRVESSNTKGMSLSTVIMDELSIMFADGDEVEYTTIETDYEDATPIMVKHPD